MPISYKNGLIVVNNHAVRISAVGYIRCVRTPGSMRVLGRRVRSVKEIIEPRRTRHLFVLDDGQDTITPVVRLPSKEACAQSYASSNGTHNEDDAFAHDDALYDASRSASPALSSSASSAVTNPWDYSSPPVDSALSLNPEAEIWTPTTKADMLAELQMLENQEEMSVYLLTMMDESMEKTDAKRRWNGRGAGMPPVRDCLCYEDRTVWPKEFEPRRRCWCENVVGVGVSPRQ